MKIALLIALVLPLQALAQTPIQFEGSARDRATLQIVNASEARDADGTMLVQAFTKTGFQIQISMRNDNSYYNLISPNGQVVTMAKPINSKTAWKFRGALLSVSPKCSIEVVTALRLIETVRLNPCAK